MLQTIYNEDYIGKGQSGDKTLIDEKVEELQRSAVRKKGKILNERLEKYGISHNAVIVERDHNGKETYFYQDLRDNIIEIVTFYPAKIEFVPNVGHSEILKDIQIKVSFK